MASFSKAEFERIRDAAAEAERGVFGEESQEGAELHRKFNGLRMMANCALKADPQNQAACTTWIIQQHSDALEKLGIALPAAE